MAEWTSEQSSNITDLWKQVEQQNPNYAALKDDLTHSVFPASGPIPYEKAKGILTSLLPQKEAHEGLEAKVSSHSGNHASQPISKWYYAAGLAAAASLVIALASGVYVPL